VIAPVGQEPGDQDPGCDEHQHAEADEHPGADAAVGRRRRFHRRRRSVDQRLALDDDGLGLRCGPGI
jgi:hypothetical protein